MPKITVAIPIYNAGKYLENCIKSVMNQTFEELQILLINDGSTDNSGEICDIYAKKDLRIEVYHKENAGVSETRNFAITKAEGKYICFVDSDDEIDKCMIENLYESIEIFNADMAICGHKSVCVEKDKRKVIEHECSEFNGTTKEFLDVIDVFLNSESVQGPCGKLYKVSTIQNNKIHFPIELSFGEDTMFVYSYLRVCNSIVSIPNCYYSYMKWNYTSLSSTVREDKINIYLQLYDELKYLLEKFNITNKQDMIEKKICVSAISCITELYDTNKNITKKLKRNIISTTIFNEKVLYCFSKQSNSNKQNRLIYFLAKRKLIGILQLYFNIKEFIRKKYGYLYTRLKAKANSCL
ncbi:glycosyltransferase family 2 protein [Haloimpatiens lingqiaonensis]|uniref:glycosyltransferase family 2 protein n=1 Tax=Haloimpatiens lingqiaonensis TaxID=1380675 RepID=UPI0010FF4685|nr:glycosyltransferase [Haloimpatiens lingqiaonensis]